MKINVTKKHIKIGRPCDPFNCPVALAIRKSFGTDKVCVRISTVKVKGRFFRLPEKAKRFINTFDIKNNPRSSNPRGLRPFSFELVKA